MYHDAYTLQKVEPEHLASFNFAAGMVPFLLNLIQDVSKQHRMIVCTQTFSVQWRICVVFYISAVVDKKSKSSAILIVIRILFRNI